MRKVKNITVCVSPEVYREARILAAEYDATVSAFVAFLLPRLRVGLERLRFRENAQKSTPRTTPSPAVSAASTAPANVPNAKTAISGCETVPDTLTREESAACKYSAAPGTAAVQL